MEELRVRVEGRDLYVRHRAGGKTAFLLTHGFNSDIRELGDAAETLHEAGFSTYEFDQRGFGQSEGERGRIDLARFTKDMDAVVALAKENGAIKIMGLGHSLGASLLLGYASRGGMHGLVLAHPPRNLWEELRPMEQAYFSLRARIGHSRMKRGKHAGYAKYPVRPQHIAREPTAVAYIQSLNLLQKKANVANYDFARTMNAEQWARRIQCPALFITSEHDAVISPKNTLKVMNAIKTPLTHVEHLGGHSCFLDHDKAHVLEELLHWSET